MALLKNECDSILHLAGESTRSSGRPESLSGISGERKPILLEQALDKRKPVLLKLWCSYELLGDLVKCPFWSCSPHRPHSEYQGSRQGAFRTLPLTLFQFSFSPKHPLGFYTYSWSHCNNPHKPASHVLTGPPQCLITLCAIPIGTCPKQAATLQEKASQLTHVKC